MSRLGDYMIEMRTRRLLDREIERLLAGAPVEDRDLALLSPVVEGLRSRVGEWPEESEVRSFATRAASVVLERSPHPTNVTAAKSHRRRMGLSPRLAAATLAVLMVPAMTGAALAADSAIPGDPLYGLDRALEAVGIASGSTEERLEEAAELAADGRSQQAIEHAIAALQAGTGGATHEMALQALETLVDFPTTGVDRAEVVALLAYISENIGEDVGTDGREFGQGVAELAREIAGDNGAGDNPATGGPDSPTTDPNGPPAVNPGQGQQPPVGQGNSNGQAGNDAAQNENGAQNGTGNGNAGTTGNTGNPNGNGDAGPPDGNGDAGPPDGNGDAGPPDDVSTPQPAVDETADPVAPDSGGIDADEGNEDMDQGTQDADEGDQVDTKPPKPESPSLTTPGRLGASS